MRCDACGTEIEARTNRRRFCSPRCRAAAWQRKRDGDLARIEDALVGALARVRAIRGRAKDPP